MNREPNNRKTNNFPDLFDEALELEETIVKPSFEEAVLSEESSVDTTDLSVDPTFFDEQVINVPIIDPPDMKSISSYPDTQIYDHLFSTDDDFLLDEEEVEDVITSIGEDVPQPDIGAPREEIDEITLAFPDSDSIAIPEIKTTLAAAGAKPSKKPPVRRAGMQKKEAVKAEEPVVIEETNDPIRKKPRVKRAGEKASVSVAKSAATPSAAVPTEVPPIALMEVSISKKSQQKKPEGKPGAPQKRPAGKTNSPQKKPTGNRPVERPEAKPHSTKRERPRIAEEPTETRKTVEEKALPKKRPFSPLEKMKKRLAQKWS